MNYFQGFVIPVKTANKQAYLDMAISVAPLFHEHGATRVVESWGDDVMAGKTTDFRKAVQAGGDESIVFSWIEWPDRATCDAAEVKMRDDARMQPSPDMPFDGKRLIYGGFEIAHHGGSGGRAGYVDGIVASMPTANRAAYVDFARRIDAFFLDDGAARAVDGWGVNVPAGHTTDFQRAVQAQPDDTIVFGWLEWPDRATRDAAFARVMQNEEMRAIPPVWNGALAIFGGFTVILDTASA